MSDGRRDPERPCDDFRGEGYHGRQYAFLYESAIVSHDTFLENYTIYLHAIPRSS